MTTAAAIAACLEAKDECLPQAWATAPATVERGNMVKMLAFLAAWRPCNSCGARVLYIDDNGRTDTQLICGHCEERAERELASAAVSFLGVARAVVPGLLPPRS